MRNELVERALGIELGVEHQHDLPFENDAEIERAQHAEGNGRPHTLGARALDEGDQDSRDQGRVIEGGII